MYRVLLILMAILACSITMTACTEEATAPAPAPEVTEVVPPAEAVPPVAVPDVPYQPGEDAVPPVQEGVAGSHDARSTTTTGAEKNKDKDPKPDKGPGPAPIQ